MKARPIFLVDKDTPFAPLLFSGLGRVALFGGSDPSSLPDILESADVLSVRSSTKVDSRLLSRCRNLKVLVTPVVGTDHIDMAAVQDLSARLGWVIPVFNAAGSTADAVSDWTIGAIVRTIGRIPRSVAIIGVGNIGRQVARRLDLLGIPYITCDPGRNGEPGFVHVPITEALTCEVVTFHVPMTWPGQSLWPTAGMLSVDLCIQAAQGGCQLLVNSSRGGIVVPDVFSLAQGRRPLLACDVFLDEPVPAPDQIAACAIATPHLAGSGRYGRAKAVIMVRDKVCATLGLSPAGIEPGRFQLPDRPAIHVNPGRISDGDNFVRFSLEISLHSGISISSEFRTEYLAAPTAGRAGVFTSFRAAGTRTEPLWIGSCD